MDTAKRQEKGKSCVLSSVKVNLSFRKIAITSKKNRDKTRNTGITKKNKWTFFRISTCFLNFLPLLDKETHSIFLFTVLQLFTYAQTDTRPHIAHSASFLFLPSPFTFTPNSLNYSKLTSEQNIHFNTSQVKVNSPLPSPLRY